MSKKTLITAITEGQKKQVRTLLEDAVDRAIAEGTLDKDGLQKLIENGRELQNEIVKLIAFLTRPQQYANEKVLSNFTYPKEHKGPKPIKDQIDGIAKIFDLDPAMALNYAKNLPQLPDGAEGWFAIPAAHALAAKHFPEATDPAEKYCYAVQLVNSKIAYYLLLDNRRYCDWVTPTQLRVHARTECAFNLIAEVQKGDILIVAAQLGKRHCGCSIRNARKAFVANEFGLGSLAVGSIILTHIDQLIHLDGLNMDCTGDKFASRDGAPFSYAPIFSFGDNWIKFGARWYGAVRGDCGSVSAFLPQ